MVAIHSDIVAKNGIEGTWHYGPEHQGYGTAYLDYTPEEYLGTRALQDVLTDSGLDPMSAEFAALENELVQIVGWMFAGSDRYRLHHTSLFTPGVEGYRPSKTYHAYSVVDFGADSSARFVPDDTQAYVEKPGVMTLYHGTSGDFDPSDIRASGSGMYGAGVYFATEKSVPKSFAHGEQGTIHSYDIDPGTVLNIDSPGGKEEYRRILGPAKVTHGQKISAELIGMNIGVGERHLLLEAGYDAVRADRSIINAQGERELGRGVEILLLADEVPASGVARDANVDSPIETLGSRIGSLTPHDSERVDLSGDIDEGWRDLLERAYVELYQGSVEPSIETWGDMPHDWQVQIKEIRQASETKRNLWFMPRSTEDMMRYMLLMHEDLATEWTKIDPTGAMKSFDVAAPSQPFVPAFRQWDNRKIETTGRRVGRGRYRVKDLFGESVLDQVVYPSSRFDMQHANVMMGGSGVDDGLSMAYEYRFQDRRTGEGGVHMVETVDPHNPHVQPVLITKDLMPYVKNTSTDAVGKPRLVEHGGPNGEKKFGNGLVVTADAQLALNKSYPEDMKPTLVTKGSDEGSIFDMQVELTNQETGNSHYEDIKYAAVYLPPDAGELPTAPQAGVPQIMYDHQEVVTYFDDAYGVENLYRLKLNYGKDGRLTSVTVEGSTVHGGNIIQELVAQGGVSSRVKVRYKQVTEVPLK